MRILKCCQHSLQSWQIFIRKFLFFNIFICSVLAQSMQYYCNYCFCTPAQYSHQTTGSSVRMQNPQVLFLVAQNEVEKRINNSSNFLELDGNMLVWVLLKLLQPLVCYFNTMADPSFQHVIEACCLLKALDFLQPQSKSRQRTEQ